MPHSIGNILITRAIENHYRNVQYTVGSPWIIYERYISQTGEKVAESNTRMNRKLYTIRSRRSKLDSVG
jgi:hypothetical protein